MKNLCEKIIDIATNHPNSKWSDEHYLNPDIDEGSGWILEIGDLTLCSSFYQRVAYNWGIVHIKNNLVFLAGFNDGSDDDDYTKGELDLSIYKKGTWEERINELYDSLGY